MAAPVIDSRNDFQVANDADNLYQFSLTNTPPAGGVIVVLYGIYAGADGLSSQPTITAVGGSGITITMRANNVPTTQAHAIGTVICTVEYSTAPTALVVKADFSGATGMYASGSALNITGQAESYFDVAGTGTGTSTTPSASGMGDLTDATDLVLGVVTRAAVGAMTINPATNWTEVVEIEESNTDFQFASIIQRTPGATGAFDPAWTFGSSDTWWAAGVAIKGTAGGGVSLKGRKTLLGVGL